MNNTYTVDSGNSLAPFFKNHSRLAFFSNVIGVKRSNDSDCWLCIYLRPLSERWPVLLMEEVE